METSEAQYLEQLGKPVTPDIAGTAFVSLATGGVPAGAYMLTADGLQPPPGAPPANRPEPSPAVKAER
jgi:hypothetical protein